MTGLEQYLAQALRNIENDGQLRRVYPLCHLGGGKIQQSGRTYLNLSGNDYLGLATDKKLVEEFYRQVRPDTILEQFGPGAAASRLMTGNSALYDKLEVKLAKLYGSEASLVFNSGYHGNTGILPALATKGDLVLADKLCHASLVDGMRLSRAESVRYRHLDYEQLEDILWKKRDLYNRVILVTESIFSMDGDMADLPKLVDLKKKYNCSLYIDEAHAVGVFGPRGLGLAEQENVLEEIDLLFGTFGKALGGVGGFIVCSRIIADFLINKARTLMYTTGLPPVCLSWLLFILDRIPSMQAERKQVQETAAMLRRNLIDQGLSTGGSTQIVPVIIGDSARTVSIAQKLQKNGFWVTAVRPPTVPAGTARLRLSLSAAMNPDELSPLAALIASALD